MIKVETVGNGIKVEMEGTPMDLMADTAQIVDAIIATISAQKNVPEEVIRETILYCVREVSKYRE